MPTRRTSPAATAIRRAGRRRRRRSAPAWAGRMRAGIAYGPHPRQRFDLFLPEGDAGAGSSSSSTAATGGPSTAGRGRISPAGRWRGAGRWRCRATCWRPRRGSRQITAMSREAVAAAAAEVAGPLRLAGHSAGGHLVARHGLRRQPAAGGGAGADRAGGADQRRPRPAAAAAARRSTRRCGSTRPRRRRRARRCSSRWRALPVHAWVGDDERPEFVRQSELLANVWTGLGADMALTIEPRRHHFDVIDGADASGLGARRGGRRGGAAVKSQARVVVIGGGVVGCSVLYHLAKAGLDRRDADRALGADQRVVAGTRRAASTR